MVPLESPTYNGPRHRTVIVAVLTRLILAEWEEEIQVQQRNPINRGQNTDVRYQRRLLLMCLDSTSGSNMFMMFHGYGNNPRILECDVLLRYNGTLRKFVVIQLNCACLR
jgi:hypothetical protein